MKSKLKKRFIITSILLLILIVGSFIIYANREKITNFGINGSAIEKSLSSKSIKEEVINEDNSQYDSTEDGNIILLEYCGDEECAVVPKELDGRKIEKIDSKAFINKDNLEKIKIPVEIAGNIEQIEDFEVSEALSDKEYVVYITTKEYTEGYLYYMQLTDEEKAKRQVIPPKFSTKEQNADIMPQSSEPSPQATIPSSYNLKSRINIPVKDQGELGICYAYVCTAMTETNLALKGISRNESEIHLAVKSGEYVGGNYSNVYTNYWKRGYGPVNEVGNTLLQQPYLTNVRGSNPLAARIYNACKTEGATVSASDVAELDKLNPGQEHYVMSLQYFQSIMGDQKGSNAVTNRNNIKQAIMNKGAVFATICSISDNNYADYGTRAVMRAKGSGYDWGHAVSLIGWDDNFSASYFPSSFGVTQNGAWLAQNSYGSNWGNGDGLFWISYQDYGVEAYNAAIGELSIGKVNVNNTSISLSNTSYAYNGTARTPSVTLVYNGTQYTKGIDYNVSYSNNVNPGTATATITGIGRFTGTVTKTFTIQSKSISSATVTLGTTNYTYDGSVKNPTVKVVDGGTTLTNRNPLYSVL